MVDPTAPRGGPQIEVKFDIDANAILNVIAKEAKVMGTGKEQSISITGASTLDKSEVEKMVKEAEKNDTADKERRKRINLKNQADSLSYQAEKQMKDLEDKVSASDKTKVEGLVKDLREAISKDDFDRIKSQMTELQQTLYTIGSNIYQQAGGGTSSGGDDVIDAEFTQS